jgi:hypothetical protein
MRGYIKKSERYQINNNDGSEGLRNKRRNQTPN